MEKVPETVPAPTRTKFEVFINHRGPDVKKTIASLIYHRLKNSGYKVFLDKNELNPGDIISPGIESASVHVAIFSTRYAESTWSLEELHLMLKSFNEKRSTIIPVFYDVRPRDLRHIEGGCYATFFENHEQKGRVSKEDLEKWKTALKEASYISGLLFKTKESDYGDFLEDVAKAVLNLVASKSEPLKVAKYPVGLDQVFINHRGSDVKKTIASLISHRLTNSGYNVFLDKNELNAGDDISPAIQDAIESASVHVAIFSERYAESTWCLEELHLMLKSFKEKRSRIITVFSDVQPHDLRHIEGGCYAESFKNHERKGRVSKEDLEKWKTALNEASLIYGFEFKTEENDYGDFLEDVAKAVLNLVASKSEPLEAHLAINSESFSHSVGEEIATFLASCGILSKAWEESCLAINSESYSLNEYEGVAYVGFPSFHEIEGFIVKESKYGECNIQTDNKVFSGCLKGNDDQPAFVHQGALKLLLHIMENTDFQAKLQIYTDSKQKKLKPIIFVGHFLGGAVATLATLWVLQKRLRQSSPFCVTFGCPLVGDGRLVEAVGRENWAGNFCHVVSKNDIVPRMLLAPFESTAEPLNALLPYWRGKISNARNDEPDSFIRDAYRALLQSVRQLDTSPYRPFGTYMFCSSHGAACIANSETVLEMLQLTMQSQETSSDKIVQDCLLEHIRYGSVLEQVIQNSICGRRIANSNSESSYERGISLELEAIGIGAQNDRARIAIQKAGDIENKHNTNVAKLGIELRQQRCTMAELEWYKECCEKEDLFYYDSFKIYNRKDNMDADANSLRVKLALFWDDIMEKWGRNELPSNFQSQIKWINAGTAYRRLVEPLDIAHYYRMCKGKGNYLSDGRPNRHKVLQKWMEEKEETGSALIKLPSLSRDSCFCAHVEEALKDFENLQRGQYGRLESLEKFEDYVTRMINEGGISPDVIKRTHAGSDSIPSSLHHLSSKSPLKVLSIKVSSSNKS